jgi:tetratricopeptide (TPR) repeat protein
MIPPHDSDNRPTLDLFEKIKLGTNHEKKIAIDALVEAAERSNNPDGWSAAALGYHQAGMFDQEIEILTQLVHKFPAMDVYRLNLATAYSQVESIDMCRFHLGYLVEHGLSEEARRIGQEQLRGYEAFIGLGEIDVRLRQLQVDFLRENIARDSLVASNYVKLAGLLKYVGKLEPGGGWFSDAVAILETGLAACADRREILEHLGYYYAQSDPNRRLDATLRQLEQEVPDSNILESLANLFREGGGPDFEGLTDRARLLMQEAGRPDKALVEAAIRDLVRIVDGHPGSISYRLIYAFALVMAERRGEALRQAEGLSELSNHVHSFHFNLGQIFWCAGDPVRGRHHLELAIQFATDEQQERDARDQIAELEGTR